MAVRLRRGHRGDGKGSKGEMARKLFASRSCARAALVAFAVAAAACGKARSSGPPQPDFAGTWDIAFEDSVYVELHVGESALRGRVDGSGGTLRFELPEGESVSLAIDCTSPELDCPFEVLPRELKLDANAPGRLDSEGVQLARPLAGSGRGECVARPGSFLTAEVLSSPQPGAARPEALALTGGRANLILPASCLAKGASLPKGAEVVLSSGFTAAKR